ncbi:MAG: bifunctional folylpolyglutamate synthase/dihydrofolate synthase [Chloroflexi bacterium]|nr:bifunctional folylpolyglutamate synthase/dihydrofolate synthase [Chloroflexota bacterium]
MNSYRDALNYIYSFTNFEVTPATQYGSKTFDLTRMERLLAALGDPQSKFQSVHVAGTKGKGSTAAMIEIILRAAGQRTGLYTSPHLHTFRERIRVDGAMISESAVVTGVERIKPTADALPQVTTFEIMTALAFDYFAARGVEFAVLEVGLGGRLDATNVVTPRLSVITSISYDHTAILGKTLTEIAREKAGIIKPGIPVVTSPQQAEALAVIQETAREKVAPLTVISPDFRFQISDFRFQILSKSQTLELQTFDLARTSYNSNFALLTFDLRLVGRHQLVNAATALATISVLREQGIAVLDEAIREGLATVQWPGRFEILEREPLVVVDGAHNADSARQLIETIHSLHPHTPIHLIFGASNDKDIAGMFAELLPHTASLIITRSHNPRAADPAQLVESAQDYHVATSIAPDLSSALRQARERANRTDVICVTGSLFVVAEAREAWFAEHGKAVESD